jgi:hypothetical protein
MRTTGIRSDVTETEHVQVPTTTGHGRQTRRVVSPLIAIERLEQPAIKRRLKHSAQTVQVEGIGNNELSVHGATCGLLPCDRQRGLCHISSQNVQPQRGNVKGVLACPASCIENCAGERAFARQAHYRGLWFSSVPRRRTIEIRRIPGPARPPLVTGWLPPAVRIVGSDSCLLGHLRVFPATGIASLIVATLTDALAGAGRRGLETVVPRAKETSRWLRLRNAPSRPAPTDPRTWAANRHSRARSGPGGRRSQNLSPRSDPREALYAARARIPPAPGRR